MIGHRERESLIIVLIQWPRGEITGDDNTR